MQQNNEEEIQEMLIYRSVLKVLTYKGSIFIHIGNLQVEINDSFYDDYIRMSLGIRNDQVESLIFDNYHEINIHTAKYSVLDDQCRAMSKPTIDLRIDNTPIGFTTEYRSMLMSKSIDPYYGVLMIDLANNKEEVFVIESTNELFGNNLAIIHREDHIKVDIPNPRDIGDANDCLLVRNNLSVFYGLLSYPDIKATQ